MSKLRASLDRLDAAAHRWLVARGMALLRISLGAVFLGFGMLKFVPGLSPAADLATATTDILFLGLVPGSVALVMIAVLESVIGLLLITGRRMRLAILLLAGQFVGILSPLVLLPERLFSGPGYAPTLEGQYVLKDVILVAAVLVVAITLRGGHLAKGDHSAGSVSLALAERPLSAAEKFEIVMAGSAAGRPAARVCAERGVSLAEYEEWRRDAALGAQRILARHDERIAA